MPSLHEPFFTLLGWPEDAWDNVNVLCEGPSVREFDPGELLWGPTVAVNHALSLGSQVGIDAWASVDPPGNLWRWAQPWLHRKTKIFTTLNNLLMWRDALGDGHLDRVYSREPTFMEGLIGMDGKAPALPTLFHVLPWLLQVGAKRVRIFGCDMEGSGSALHQSASESWSEDEDEGWQLRWQVERTLLARTALEYRKRGKKLERWQPRKNRTRSLRPLFS